MIWFVVDGHFWSLCFYLYSVVSYHAANGFGPFLRTYGIGSIGLWLAASSEALGWVTWLDTFLSYFRRRFPL